MSHCRTTGRRCWSWRRTRQRHGQMPRFCDLFQMYCLFPTTNRPLQDNWAAVLELATDAGPAGSPAEVAQAGLVRRRVRDLIEAVLRCATAGPVLPGRAACLHGPLLTDGQSPDRGHPPSCKVERVGGACVETKLGSRSHFLHQKPQVPASSACRCWCWTSTVTNVEPFSESSRCGPSRKGRAGGVVGGGNGTEVWLSQALVFHQITAA